MSTTAYTELETLLLFQALRAEGLVGITSTTFNRISEQLRTLPLIRNDPRYDAGRLDPDALRQLFLDLLKEESKRELQRQSDNDRAPSDGSPPATKKRKASALQLPTARDAAQQHTHLIPQLVYRLYAIYREEAVTSLQKYEKEHNEKRGLNGDGDIQQDKNSHERRSTTQSSVSGMPLRPSPTAQTLSNLPRDDEKQTAHGSVGTHASSHPAAGESTHPQLNDKSSGPKFDSLNAHGPEPDATATENVNLTTNTRLPPLTEVPLQHQRSDKPPHPNVLSYQHQGGQNQQSQINYQSHYGSQHAHPHSGPAASPYVHQPLSQPSTSPRPTLPPPNSMQLPPPSPSPHVGASASHASSTPPHRHNAPPYSYQTQPHHSPAPLPSVESLHRPFAATPLAPQPSTYQPQHSPSVDRRGSYPTQHGLQAQYLQQAPASGGHVRSPYQMQPQTFPDPSGHHRIRAHPAAPAARRLYPYSPLPSSASGPGSRTILPQPSPLISEVIAALATPRVNPLWKSRTPAHVQMTPKPRPDFEPLSPTMEDAKPAGQGPRYKQEAHMDSAEDDRTTEQMSKGRSAKRKVIGRERSPRASAQQFDDESTRVNSESQSARIPTTLQVLQDGYTGNEPGVKTEALTPAADVEDSATNVNPSAAPAPGMVTRKRRGTVTSQAQPTAKRKRPESSDTASAEDVDHIATPPPRSNKVMATRNFAKMASAIMNDITSHKHASYFAKEVRERDAPGYADIVRRPQNLKAIRSAMTAGARAITNASSNVDSPSATASLSAGTVELERSIDVLPPRAIVNGAQLEKELMRMFANAYLFNPGEDGMALSTQEMFHDVELSIGEWRGAERDAGRDAAQEEDEGRGKRRKAA